MNLALTDDQRWLRESARARLDAYAPLRRAEPASADAGAFDGELWSAIVALEWPSVLRGELGVEGAALLLWETGRVLAPIPLASHLLATWLAWAVEGGDAWTPVLDETAAAGVFVLAAGAGRLDRPHAVIGDAETGARAPLVRDAQAADWLLCLVGDDAAPSLAALPANARGVLRRPRRTLGNLREADVEVGAAPLAGAVIAERPVTPDVRRALQSLATLLDAAEVGGACEQVLELTAEHARNRRQFGRTLGSFQAVKQRLAEMVNDLDGLRWMIHWAASDPDDHVLADQLGVWASQASRRIVAGAHQIHGGVGFIRDHPLHRYFGRQKALEVTWGTEREAIAMLAGAPSPTDRVKAASS